MVIALFVNMQTDGAVPVKCEISRQGNYLQIKCNGDGGFMIEVPIKDVELVLADELHG